MTNIYTQEGNTDIYYDKNGNMRDILYAGGAKEHYDYDEYGQLVKVSNSKDQSFTYSYDAEGDRIHYKKNVKDTYDKDTWYQSLEETEFKDVEALLEDKDITKTFDAFRYQANYHTKNKACVNPEEYDEADWYAKDVSYVIDKSLQDSEILATNEDFYIYGEMERLASESTKTNGTSKTTRYINGNNNSVYAVSESELSWSGPKTTYKEYEYDDFGYSDDMRSGFSYNGEVLDDDGLLYLRARYYNPIIGQFIQLDENKGSLSNIASQNRYAFAMQNPNRYIDKDGRMAIQMSDRRGHSEENNLTYKSNKKKEALKKEREEKALKKALKKLDKQPAKAPVKYNGGGSAKVKGISVVGNAVTKGAKPKPVKETGNKGKSSKKQPDCKKHWYDGVVNGLKDFGKGLKAFSDDLQAMADHNATRTPFQLGLELQQKDWGKFAVETTAGVAGLYAASKLNFSTASKMFSVMLASRTAGVIYDAAPYKFDMNDMIEGEGYNNVLEYLGYQSGNLIFDGITSYAIGNLFDSVSGIKSTGNKRASGAKIKLKGTYSPEYTKKLQDTYKIFKNQGHELSEHSLNRILGRINQGKIGSVDDVLNTLKSGTKYVDTVNGGTVVFKDGISIHMAEDGTIKTVIGNAKVKSTWEVIK